MWVEVDTIGLVSEDFFLIKQFCVTSYMVSVCLKIYIVGKNPIIYTPLMLGQNNIVYFHLVPRLKKE